MEEIDLTSKQFEILLNMTAVAKRADKPAAALLLTLQKARVSGHKWYVKMSEQDVETALTLFEENQATVRTPAAQTALSFFVRGSSTAMRAYAARKEQADVPRETSEPT